MIVWAVTGNAMNKKITLIIFDCDGVLIDSEILSAQVLIKKLSEIGIVIDTDYVQKHYLGCSFKSVTEKILNAFGLQLSPEFEDEYRVALMAQFNKTLQATLGVKDVLAQLSLPFCLATSSSRARTQQALAITGLSDYFEGTIFTAEEVKNGKPAPDLFLHAAHSMAASPANCLVIEDSLAGVTAAKAAGMQLAHYSGGSHIAESEDMITKAFPDVPVIKSWQDFEFIQPSLFIK